MRSGLRNDYKGLWVNRLVERGGCNDTSSSLKVFRKNRGIYCSDSQLIADEVMLIVKEVLDDD